MKHVGYKFDIATKKFETTVQLDTYIPIKVKDTKGWQIFNNKTSKIRSRQVFASEQDAAAYATELELMASRRL